MLDLDFRMKNFFYHFRNEENNIMKERVEMLYKEALQILSMNMEHYGNRAITAG